MKETQVLPDNQGSADRVHQLESAAENEHNACQNGKKTSESLVMDIHFEEIFRKYQFCSASTSAFTFAKISSGGSIRPCGSEQSTRMNEGSSSHWRR